MSGGRPLVQTSLLPHISRAPRASNDDDDDCQKDENMIVTKSIVVKEAKSEYYNVEEDTIMTSMRTIPVTGVSNGMAGGADLIL